MSDFSYFLRLIVEAESYEDAEQKLGEALEAMDDVPAEIHVIPEPALPSRETDLPKET